MSIKAIAEEMEPITRLNVIGLDKEGNKFKLVPKGMEYNNYDYTTTIYVALPFDPEHRIWDELRATDSK